MLSLAAQYLSPGTGFAVALIAVLVCFVLYWLKAVPAPLLPAEAPRPRLRFPTRRTPMTRRDALVCLAVTLAYAATAFFHLGSLSAPQTTVDFAGKLTVEYAFADTVYLTGLDYFPSLGTGGYNVEISADGAHWSTLWPKKEDQADPSKITGYYWADAAGFEPSFALAQGYNDLFKWKSVTVDNPQNVKYLRLTGLRERDTLQLAELVLLGQNGQALPVPTAVVSTYAGQAVAPEEEMALFDEQDTHPEKASWYNSAYFDEIYHPRTALEHIENFRPYETTHPPLGKLILGLGIRLFGMTPFGWRFMGTLLGTLMLPLLYVFLKNFFGRSLIAACGTILFATDFMHLTQTRIATIDTYAVFFILGAYFFLYRWISLPRSATFRQGVPSLLLSGLFFGLGAASKWTVLYAGVGMALLYLLNLIFRFRDRREGDPPFWPWCAKTILISILFFVVIPVCLYTLSYYPYALDRGDPSLSGMWKVMLENQKHMFSYHQGVTTPHHYASKWWMWLVDAKPILYYMDNTPAGFSTRFAAFLNPLVCWGGLLALFLLGRQLARRRDGRALFILVAYLSQLLPWVPISRPTFNYHYFPSVPFLVMALCYLFSELARTKPEHWKRWVVGLTAGSTGIYLAFYPVLIGLTIPRWYSTLLRWLPSWPF